MQMFKTTDGPEHRRQLRESVSTFVSRNATPEKLRSSLQGQGGYDACRWTEAAGSGWLALLVPEALDGIGMELADLSALHQELGRGGLRDPLAEVALLVIEAIVKSDKTALRDRILPDVIAGERLACLAWAADASAFDATMTGPQATPQGDGWRLSGTADCVAFADQATGGIVAARLPEGVALFWLDHLPAAVARSPQADGTILSRIDFTGVTVEREQLIAAPDSGVAILDHCLSLARLAYAAQLLGASETVLAMTVDYLKTRQQFGQALGRFQALQHRAVDLFVQVEIARSALMRAEHGGEDSLARNAAAAKARCSELARRIGREAIQLHGAIGYTQEYDLSLFVNRIITLSAQLGSARRHRMSWFTQQFPALEAAE